MDVTLTLTAEQVEVIAVRVAEILAERFSSDRGPRENEWMGVKEAAAYIGASQGRVRKLIERRQIPFSQEGRGCRVFLSRSDLDRWMAERRTGARE